MKVPFHQVMFTEREKQAVLDAMESNWFSPRGPKVGEFGQAWADYVGMKYGLVTSSGTAAIHLALLALGIGPGDKVAVPSYTCSPTVYPVTYVGAEPVFVDCELSTYGMAVDHLHKVLKEHKLKAVLVTDLYGAASLNAVFDECREAGVLIIEDACENVGGTYWGTDVPLGRQADVACYSFRGDKIITSLGTGGAVLMNDEELYHSAAYWSDLGLHNTKLMGRYRDLPVCGYNYEMSNVAAAFGLAQIETLPRIIEGRRRAADLWRKHLKSEVVVMEDYPGHVYYQWPILFPLLQSVDVLDQLGERLVERGVPLIPPFWPMHKQPVYRDTEAGRRGAKECRMAEFCSEHVFLFPCYPGLTEEQIEYMAAVIDQEYATIAGA